MSTGPRGDLRPRLPAATRASGQDAGHGGAPSGATASARRSGSDAARRRRSHPGCSSGSRSVPMVVLVVLAAFLGSVPTSPDDFELPSYAEYFEYALLPLGLFAAVVAPLLLCPDRRDGVLSLYAARPDHAPRLHRLALGRVLHCRSSWSSACPSSSSSSGTGSTPRDRVVARGQLGHAAPVPARGSSPSPRCTRRSRCSSRPSRLAARTRRSPPLPCSSSDRRSAGSPRRTSRGAWPTPLARRHPQVVTDTVYWIFGDPPDDRARLRRRVRALARRPDRRARRLLATRRMGARRG